MATSPNIMLSNNPAVLNGGAFGTIIEGNGITIDPTPGETTIVGTVNLDSVVVDGADINGNLTFIGSGRRIRADFSNATASNRTLFQTSTTNAGTTPGIIPNGTSQASSFTFFDSSDPNNAGRVTIGTNNFGPFVNTSKNGTGTVKRLSLLANDTIQAVRIDPTGSVAVGINNQTTTSTDGFAHLSSVNGTPTGTPTGISGYAPITVDSTNNKLYFYSGGAWQTPVTNNSGTATLVAGTATVSAAAVKTTSIILVTRNTPGGTLGFLSAPSASIVDGVSFDINSDINTDTSTVNWLIIN